MKRALSFLLLLSFALAASGNYNIVVAENGNAYAVLTITGQGTFSIPLPLDAASPQVKGGLYLQTPTGIDITIGNTGIASITYMSSLLTSKQGNNFLFELDLPNLDSISITLSLPPNVAVSNTNPSGTIAPSEKSMNVIWTGKPTKISATYAFTEVTPTQDNTLLYIGIIVVIIIIVLALILVSKKKVR